MSTRQKMTALERQVWAAAYGAAFDGDNEGDAFERATYAVQGLRELRREGGPFGTDCGESSQIEAEIFEEVR